MRCQCCNALIEYNNTPKRDDLCAACIQAIRYAAKESNIIPHEYEHQAVHEGLTLPKHSSY